MSPAGDAPGFAGSGYFAYVDTGFSGGFACGGESVSCGLTPGVAGAAEPAWVPEPIRAGATGAGSVSAGVTAAAGCRFCRCSAFGGGFDTGDNLADFNFFVSFDENIDDTGDFGGGFRGDLIGLEFEYGLSFLDVFAVFDMPGSEDAATDGFAHCGDGYFGGHESIGTGVGKGLGEFIAKGFGDEFSLPDFVFGE